MDRLPEDKGSDTQGGKYSSIQDLWVSELGKPGEEGTKEVTWYPKAGMLLLNPKVVINCLFYGVVSMVS